MSARAAGALIGLGGVGAFAANSFYTGESLFDLTLEIDKMF